MYWIKKNSTLLWIDLPMHHILVNTTRNDILTAFESIQFLSPNNKKKTHKTNRNISTVLTQFSTIIPSCKISATTTTNKLSSIRVAYCENWWRIWCNKQKIERTFIFKGRRKRARENKTYEKLLLNVHVIFYFVKDLPINNQLVNCL